MAKVRAGDNSEGGVPPAHEAPIAMAAPRYSSIPKTTGKYSRSFPAVAGINGRPSEYGQMKAVQISIYRGDNLSKLIIDDHGDDGIDRRGFLKCMAWAGTGVAWSVSG